ncbi:MAG: 2-succinyl-5-enolpyruvyl-6-hydroxy-3-cyclohexene-1-carboxylic-acid synthase [Actinomycetota bacterium]|nr:2-succinyl-5-enolpyruvyl-6-hydroxy-3-cyclohexene-1-carboxylic-acid synthase [Actinomycetota bacterium]
MSTADLNAADLNAADLNAADLNTALSRTLVDEWVRAGVSLAAVSPGSRSTPLALALAGDSRLDVQVFLDERSASFFALGAAKASGRPVVLLCTSGTAAAEFHPGVLEAFHARVPLVVCTADRPPELRDTGAGQAVDQLKLYGDAVRWFAEVGAPSPADAGGPYWRSIAARAVAAASGPPAGPVHLNLAFREPLVPTGADVALPPGRADGAPWVTSSAHPPRPHPDDIEQLALLVAGTPRGVVVAGWGAGVDPVSVERFSATAGWPVLADPISGVRQGPNAVSTYDAMLRSAPVARSLRPDVVLRLGAPLTGKTVTSWLDPSVPQLVVDPDGAWLDPLRASAGRIVADPTALLDAVSLYLLDRGDPARARSFWLGSWLQAEAATRRVVDGLLDGWPEPFEGRVARDLVAALPGGATLVVGSSMPVRDVESFARPRAGLRFLSNRGVNGIDGFVSTVLGVAATVGDREGPVVALCGDLTFLHDAGGLLGATRRGLDATFVVVDNDGGGIFSFLPQARSEAGPGMGGHFETLFGTPQGVDLAALAGVHGMAAERVTKAGDLLPALDRALAAGGVRLVIVPTDRVDNADRHRRVWEAASIPGAAGEGGGVTRRPIGGGSA